MSGSGRALRSSNDSIEIRPLSRCITKGTAMKASAPILGFALFAFGAGLAHAAPPRPSAAPRAAINTQPLPPRHGGVLANDKINPQPLPPRSSQSTVQGAPARPYIGDTEKN